MALVPSDYSRGEEAANVACHGIAALGSVVGLITLLQMAVSQGSALHVVTCAIFGSALILVYSASTLYHTSSDATRRQFWQYVDHCAIYILIAGTYTPFCLVLLQGAWGWTLFGLAWASALLGIGIKSSPRWRECQKLSLASYLGAGWMLVIAINPMWETLEPGAFKLIVAGGLAYTFGVIFFVWETLMYSHAIWHLMVMLGSGLHFVGVLWYVIPTAMPA